MPIEIRELVIRAVVEPPPREPGGEALGEDQHSLLIQKCVDEVLKKLRRERER